ncbi:twin-arginine translocase TatA/TatE family subunit [Candidatus Sumerlaeota bacterium]|nr:twin-arginine translocase TatA/TatE family subunit [Candidatus Sumerlaeota bacterium]
METSLAAGLFGLGTPELIIILLAILLIFGPSQLPKLGRMFGRGVRDFRDATKAMEESADDDDEPRERRRVADDKRNAASRAKATTHDSNE